MEKIPMYVHSITLDPESNAPILILKEIDGERTLPIWIGLLEATAIATEMEKISFARPMTHDLSMNLLRAMDIEIENVEVSDLRDSTYYATIRLKQGGRVATEDARPSDAVALALRAKAMIYVNESVLGKIQPDREASAVMGEDTTEKEKWTKILEELDPDKFKYKM
ncbi:MAG TPA: bifunctional nuclease family protein [Thermodesulfobacteriaceae bacterium]|nr:bifunctional nuclease family protein [Thermodesulfobacteriaceae bacterium]